MIEPNLSLLQIAPAAPPSINGVGDYAALLNDTLQDDFGIACRTFDAGCAASGPDELVRAETLARKLREEAGAILLHYVGYGYSPNGCPGWLIRTLEQWRAHAPKVPLLVMFHELDATGPPWQRAFWIRRRQQELIRRLISVADVAGSSLERNRCRICEWAAPRRDIEILPALPIFSNVGELTDCLPFWERDHSAVVFGTEGRRSEVYRCTAPWLAKALDHAHVTEFFDLGPDPSIPPRRYFGRPVIPCGSLPARDISDRLARARVGLIEYPRCALAKSGIFAALASHALVPFVIDTRSSTDAPADGLRCSEHYLSGSIPNGDVALATMAAAVFKWYRGHSRAAHGAALASCLLQSGLRSRNHEGHNI